MTVRKEGGETKPIRVVVVEDDDFIRELMVAILCSEKGIDVVGEAADGRNAVEKVSRLKPDIVTMDINMPGMDGLEAIRQIMSAVAVPILVVTSSNDANIAYQAISRGALEVIPKPTADRSAEFISKIRLLSRVKVISHIRGHAAQKEILSPKSRLGVESEKHSIVAIASSTGGPRALSTVLSALPADFPPSIVIAQHITDNFASGLAQWLDSVCRLKVKTGEPGEPLEKATAYLAPSKKHMLIDRNRRICFQQRRPQDIYYPSCDLLLSAAAHVFGPRTIGVILTGMGDDGVAGMKRIKAAGGETIAQDEKTSVVFGMPRIAIESGCIDVVLPISNIGAKILNLLKARTSGRRSAYGSDGV